MPKILQAERRNILINGAFDFAQRGVTLSNTDNNYSADRWYTQNGGSAGSGTQRIAAPASLGTPYYFRFARTSGSGLLRLKQIMEAGVVNQYRGKSLVFSIWLRGGTQLVNDVRLTLTTTFANNAAGSGDIDTATLVIPNSDLDPTEFRKFSVTLNIPSNSTAIGLQARVDDVGPAIVGAANAYIDYAKAMLTESPYLGVFNRNGDSLAAELVACQRYYEKSYNIDVNLATGGNTAGYSEVASDNANGTYLHQVYFKVTKRVQPTPFIWSAIAGTPGFVDAGGPVLAAVVTGAGVRGMNVGSALGGGNSVGRMQWSADAEIF